MLGLPLGLLEAQVTDLTTRPWLCFFEVISCKNNNCKSSIGKCVINQVIRAKLKYPCLLMLSSSY